MGTFSGLNTALTALRFQQRAMDVASTNVANVSTEGYVRRRVVGQTLGAAAQPAMWSRSQEVGAGVTSSGVQRMTDALLDARQRREHAAQGYLDVRAEVLGRVETGMAEPGERGISAAIDAFHSALHDLVNSPGSGAARNQVLTAGRTLADAFRLQATQVNDEIADQEARLAVAVTEVNQLAGDLAKTNQAILSSAGTDASTLHDTRDRLTLRLAELTGATASIREDGQVDITLAGRSLVNGVVPTTFHAVDTPAGTRFRLGPAPVPDDGSADFVLGAGKGEIGATAGLIDVDLPDHVARLDALAAQLATDVNAVHRAGYGLDGVAGRDFFSGSSALTLAVALTDPGHVAASTVAGQLRGDNAEALIGSITIEDGYQTLVSDVGSKVSSAERLAANQATLTAQVDSARDQQAGVSLDEETVNMVMAQRGYEAAARVMSTLDEVLDTLINRMAL